MDLADQRLYAAKAQGRNRTCTDLAPVVNMAGLNPQNPAAVRDAATLMPD